MTRTALIAATLASTMLAACGGGASGNNAAGNGAGAQTAANQIPAAFHGRFRYDAAGCAKAITDSGAVGSDVSADKIMGPDLTWTVNTIEDRGNQRLKITSTRQSRSGGPAEPSEFEISLTPDGKEFRMIVNSASSAMTRCP